MMWTTVAILLVVAGLLLMFKGDLMLVGGVRLSCGPSCIGIEVMPIAKQSAPYYAGALLTLAWSKGQLDRGYVRWDLLYAHIVMQIIQTKVVSR